MGSCPPVNLGTFWAVGLRCEAGSGGLIPGSAVEGTVTSTLRVHDSPALRGLPELIKPEVAGEQTLGLISASHQAGHGKGVAELSRAPPGQCQPHGTQQAPPAPQSPSAGSCWGAGSCVPKSSRGHRASLAPKALPARGHVPHHSPSPASPLSRVLLSRQLSWHSSRGCVGTGTGVWGC